MSDVAEAMRVYAEGRDVEAILTTGDNLYVDDFAPVLEQFRWAGADGIEFRITWGNHDVEDPDRIEAVNRAFEDPPRWVAFSWGAVDMVILDSTQVNSAEQQGFLEAEMESNRPTVVALHYPPYSCAGRDDGREVLSTWVPAFDDDVVLVLAGHDHNYQHFLVDDTSYVVTGGGGAPLNGMRSCHRDQPSPVASAEAHHFLAIHQGDGRLTVEAIGVDGDLIDSFVIDLGRSVSN
jgi:hypothetical protein